jgi:DNA-binding MarR family transcriptional regulator
MNETPRMNQQCKGELLQKLAVRYPTLDPSALHIISHIQSIGRLISSGLAAQLAEYGLSEGKFYVLGYLLSEELFEHESPSPSDIAENLGVTRGTITGLLDGLERDDYIVRYDDSHDRRALRIRMTDKARQFIDQFLSGSALTNQQTIPLDHVEKRTLLELLGRVEAAMQGAPWTTEAPVEGGQGTL